MSYESVFIIEILYVDASSYDSFILKMMEDYGWGEISNIVWILKGVYNQIEFYNVQVHFKNFVNYELKQILEIGEEVKIKYDPDNFWRVKISRFSPKNLGFSQPEENIDSLVDNFNNLSIKDNL